MGVCVEIMISDSGEMSVRECDPREESLDENGEPTGQIVNSLDEAFQTAEKILVGQDGAKQAEEQAFQKGMGDVMTGTKAPINN